ncbi:type II methionyl aminopeptidase [Candidatus Woesearchaeota archaeon]|nr:type II methionyl aminopeptidase [Candidatus Woesearchaeota archaeon]|tara:strand:+ start:4158 stop:5042 length:885 start_codon:yes stop_codon:yes gene_type:complete
MENLQNYEKAGQIAREVLEYGKSLIKKDASLLDVTKKVEAKIFELNAKPAFPVQISMNDIAAHYCAEPDDKTVFSDQLVSLDVGVHVDGFIGDNACTVDLSEKNKELVEASRKALDNAIKVIQVGTTLSEIGKTIGETIESYGFKPVRNLSGHGLDEYNIHCPPTVPNFDTKDETQLEKGQAIAIEPFATNGIGLIHEKGLPDVFSITEARSVRIEFVRQILNRIDKFNGLPFAKRWLSEQFSLAKVNLALSQFKKLGILKEYPPLVEKSNGLVSQAEHSLLVDDKVKVLTEIS